MSRLNKVFLALLCMIALTSPMTAFAKETVVNEHIDSAMGTIISNVCNFSLQDIELPSVRINGEMVDLTLPDISIAKAIAFLTNFGGKTLSKTSAVFNTADEDAVSSEQADYWSDSGEFELEVDGSAVGDAAKGAVTGYFGFFKSLTKGLNSDLNPVMDHLNDYEINKNSLFFKMGGLDDEHLGSRDDSADSEHYEDDDTAEDTESEQYDYIEGD